MSKMREKDGQTDRNGLSAAQAMRRKYLLSSLLTCGQGGGKLTIAKRHAQALLLRQGEGFCGLRGDAGPQGDRRGREHPVRPQVRADAGRAYEVFRVTFVALVRAQDAIRGAALKRQDDSILERLKAVDAKLTALRDQRASLTPEPITRPTDLPALYRSYVDTLVETLTDGEISGRASDELHDLLDEVVVSWDGDLGAHGLEIRGKLLSCRPSP